MYRERRSCRPEYLGDSFRADYSPPMHRTDKYRAESLSGYVEHKDASPEMLPGGHFRKLQI